VPARYVQVLSNVACRNDSAPHVQLSGCAVFYIRFLLIHNVEFSITRASSLVLTIFLYNISPPPTTVQPISHPSRHQHFGLQLGSAANDPPSPPLTQECSSIVSGPSVQTDAPAARPCTPISRSTTSAPPPAQVGPPGTSHSNWRRKPPTHSPPRLHLTRMPRPSSSISESCPTHQEKGFELILT
jgi:hypothetical protein